MAEVARYWKPGRGSSFQTYLFRYFSGKLAAELDRELPREEPSGLLFDVAGTYQDYSSVGG